MKSEDFISSLDWLKPLPSICSSSGLGDSYRLTRLRGASPVYRKAPLLNIEEMPQEVFELFKEAELGNINFNWTFFLNSPRKISCGWQIAEQDDCVIVVAQAGGVEAYEKSPVGEGDFLINHIAKNLESFLDAMMFLGVFRNFSKREIPMTPETMIKERLLASMCAYLAGGSIYYNYWAGLIGVDENIFS